MNTAFHHTHTLWEWNSCQEMNLRNGSIWEKEIMQFRINR